MSIIGYFVRFAGAGAIGTLAHFCVLFSLVRGIGVAPLAASMAGAVAGAAVNYLLAYFYVFESKKSHVVAFPRFCLIAGQGFLLNLLLMALLVNYLGLHYVLSQVAATGLILVVNFLGNYIWTFKSN